IAGLSAAWRCARAGAPVTVLEAGRAGQATSRVAAGYLEPGLAADRLEDPQLPTDEWTSLRAYPDFVAGVEEDSGHDVDFRADGQLRLAFPEHEAAARADMAVRTVAGWAPEWLDGPALREFEPQLSPELAGACFLPEVSWVDGRKLCAALTEALRRRGALLREETRVASLILEGGAARGARLETGEEVRADRVILATGWTLGGLANLPDELPAPAPMRGVVLMLGMDPQTPFVTRICRSPDMTFLQPRAEGRLVVGVNRLPGDARPFADAGSVAAILEAAFRAAPAARTLPFLEAAWGVRPFLEGSGPVAAASREAADLIYSVGYGSSGYLRAPLWSQRAADLALGRNVPA
ncbi:MAG: FAD-dependent oxidoreductase, partial [Pseudomonadota bacterium]